MTASRNNPRSRDSTALFLLTITREHDTCDLGEIDGPFPTDEDRVAAAIDIHTQYYGAMPEETDEADVEGGDWDIWTWRIDVKNGVPVRGACVTWEEMRAAKRGGAR